MIELLKSLYRGARDVIHTYVFCTDCGFDAPFAIQRARGLAPELQPLAYLEATLEDLRCRRARDRVIDAIADIAAEEA